MKTLQNIGGALALTIAFILLSTTATNVGLCIETSGTIIPCLLQYGF